jgi:hypothetical protein
MGPKAVVSQLAAISSSAAIFVLLAPAQGRAEVIESAPGLTAGRLHPVALVYSIQGKHSASYQARDEIAQSWPRVVGIADEDKEVAELIWTGTPMDHSTAQDRDRPLAAEFQVEAIRQVWFLDVYCWVTRCRPTTKPLAGSFRPVTRPEKMG